MNGLVLKDAHRDRPLVPNCKDEGVFLGSPLWLSGLIFFYFFDGSASLRQWTGRTDLG
jgi:hypothetical protein